MKDTKYLNLLLNGLDIIHKLKPITAKAWGGDKNALYPIGKLDLESNLFYKKEKEPSDNNWGNENSFVEKLIEKHPLAGKYTSFYLAEVWGSRRAKEEGSSYAIFDDNRISAAVHVCNKHSKEGYLYVKGAITGIQSYIYDNIKSEQSNEGKKVSRRLRGRSFLIAVLGDMIAEDVVEELGLEQANILFVGGGHFNLLIPQDFKKQFNEKTWDINSKLLGEFGLKLGIVTSSTEVEQTDFKNFGSKFQIANDNLERAKQRRFGDHLNEVFFKKKLGHKKAALTKEEKEAAKAEEHAMEEIGQKIPKSTFLLEIKGGDYEKVKFGGQIKHIKIKSLSTSVVFLPTPKDESTIWQQTLDILKSIDHQNFSSLKLYRLNSTQFLPPIGLTKDFLPIPISYGFRMLGQYAPSKGEDIYDLSEIAAIDDDGINTLKYPKLAAMRLDIDDLGSLFAYGLGEQTNLRETLALSRETQLFFGGYFNKLAKNHNLYIVYSGGDDAFVLGSWINVLNFAYRLKQKFTDFTLNNQHLSFSAGIFMANPKYPIARLAYDAAEEEEKAKKFHNKKGELQKDAIRVFGHSLSWDRFKQMMDFSDQLLLQTEAKGGKIKRSAVQHLLGVIQSAHKARDLELDKQHEDNDTKKAAVEDAMHFEFYRNLGRLHALLTRRNISDNQIIKQLLQEMSDFDLFQDYLLPLHYVLYKTR